MLINLRNALMTGKRLPYDAEVEYLESTGTQWIDTGLIFNRKSFFSVDCEIYDVMTASSSYFLFGATDKTGNEFKPKSNLYINNHTRRVGFACLDNENSSVNSSIVIQDYERHVFSLDGATRSCLVDGIVCGSQNTNIGIAYTPVALFCRNMAGTASNFIKGRFYGAKAWEDNIIVLDLAPVRFTNENGQSEGAMYDRVTGELFRNRGSGAFVIGPDKPAANEGGISANA